MITELANWISDTALSEQLRDVSWIIPASQSTHIVSVSVVFGSAAMISLRLLGVGRSGRSVPQLVDTLLPWMNRGLAVLLFTGLLQTIAEPERQFSTVEFWLKMALIICAVLLTNRFAGSVRAAGLRGVSKQVTTLPGAKLFALTSLALWIGIIACGRLIGYASVLHGS